MLTAQDDPASDGWTTEAISNSATEVLKQIGKAIVNVSTGQDVGPNQRRFVADSFVAILPDSVQHLDRLIH